MLVSSFLEHCKRTPNKVLFEFANDKGEVVDKYTYAEFELKSRLLASKLVQHKGLPVLLVYPPGLDFILSFFACLRAGVIAVPVYPPKGSNNKDLAMFLSVCESCKPKLALTNSVYNWFTKVATMKELLFSLQGNAWPAYLEWMITDDELASLLASPSSPSSSAGVDHLVEDQIAFLQYTSGSTSLPKGVVLTHANLAHNLHCISQALEASPSVQVVSWLPMYHDMGLIGSHLGTMYCGGSALIFSPMDFVRNPVLWLELVSRKHATHLQAPNFAYRLTVRKFRALPSAEEKKWDFSSVQHIFNAAEPIEEECMKEFMDTFSRFGLRSTSMVPGFGLAEHTVFVCEGGKQVLHVNRIELETHNRVVVDKEKKENSMSVVGLGFPRPDSGIEVAIVHPDTRSRFTKEDVVGEIWVTSRSKANAYFGLDELSQRDLHATLVEEEELEEESVENEEVVPIQQDSKQVIKTQEEEEEVIKTQQEEVIKIQQEEVIKIQQEEVIKIQQEEVTQQEEVIKTQPTATTHTMEKQTPSSPKILRQKELHSPPMSQHELQLPNLSPPCKKTKSIPNTKIEWLRTGDLGFIHERELFVCGRIKDLIIVRGRNHFPQDLEHSVERLFPDELRPGCVCAVQSEDSVVIVAEIRSLVLKDTYESLCKSVMQTISNEHGIRVSTVCLVKERTIPKTTSGKLSRHRVRLAFLANTLVVVYSTTTSVQPQPVIPTTTTTTEYSRERLKQEVEQLLELEPGRVQESVPLSQLGFDSMMITQFKGVILSVFQVEVDDNILYSDTCTLLMVEDMILSKLKEQKEQEGAPVQVVVDSLPPPPPPLIAGCQKGQKCGFCGC